MKSYLRERYASGSTRALIERIMRGGRQPKRIRRIEWRGHKLKAGGGM